MTYVQATVANKEFAKRLDQISRRHSRLSKGYLLTVNHDGLVMARPRRRIGWFPLQGLLLTAVAVIGFKAFAFAYLGQAGYQDRVAQLADGTTSERIAAALMQADPATRALGTLVAPYMPGR